MKSVRKEFPRSIPGNLATCSDAMLATFSDTLEWVANMSPEYAFPRSTGTMPRHIQQEPNGESDFRGIRV